MRVCTKCGIAKEETDFYVKDKSGRRHAQCKACYKVHRTTYYKAHYAKYGDHYRERARKRHHELRQAFRKFMLDYMADKSCVICGETDMRVLEFDHIDPSQKSFGISQGIRYGFRLEQIMLELKKCRILCSNCHKRHTAQQFGWYKAI